MATKPLHLTRRSFVKRAGLFLSTLGVGTTIEAGIMDRIMKKAAAKWGNEALGQTAGTVHFVLEICIRAGFQMNSLFPSAGHKDAGRIPTLNIYSSQNNIPISSGATGIGGRDLYYARYAQTGVAGRAGIDKLFDPSLPGGDLARMIASSEAVGLTNGHTEDWRLRAPSGMSACPAVLHNSYAPASAVRGVEFNEFGEIVTNRVGAYNGVPLQTLSSRVSNRAGFLQLYRDLPIYFTQDELKVIVGSIKDGEVQAGRKGAVGDLNELFLTRGVQGADELVAVTFAGRGQSQLSIKQALAINGLSAAQNNNVTSNEAAFDDAMVANFGGLTEMQRSVQGNEPFGLTMAGILKAWKARALTTAVMTLDSSDWHGADNATQLDMDSTRQGMWNIGLGNALNGLLRTMATTPDPYGGGNMIDSFLIVISSEFTRTPERTDAGQGSANTNNNDGGTQGFTLIGSKVKGGTYGEISANGAIRGFDAATGNLLTAGVRPSEATVYKGIGRAMGIDSMIVDAVAGVNNTVAPPATCFVR